MEYVASPKISVVMPVLNGEKYLAEAIESILNQTFQDFEFIIVDDGSTDRTPEILQSYAQKDPRIQILTNPINRGIGYSRNRGIALSRGEYIANMDADDWCLPERFEKQVNFMDSHPDVAVLGTACVIVANDGKSQRKLVHPSQPGLIRWHLLYGVPVIQPSTIIRKKVFENPDLLYDEGVPPAEDYALWVKLAPNYKFSNLRDILYRYRWHESNISVTKILAQQNYAQEISQKQVFQITGEEIPKRLIGSLQKPQKLENITDAKRVAHFYFLLLKGTKTWGLTEEEAIDIRLDLIKRLNSAWRAIKKNPLYLGTMVKVPFLRAEILWLIAKRKLKSLVNITRSPATNG